MTQRSKNLLEAFKASSQEERPGVLPRRAKPAPKADDPFAVDTAGAKEPPPRARALHERAAAATLHSYVPALVLAILALVGLAYWLGKISKADQVSAGDRSKPAKPANPEAGSGEQTQVEAKIAAQERPQAAPPKATADEGRPAAGQTAFPSSEGTLSDARTRAEQALMDASNKYTVVMAEYVYGRDDAIAEQTLAYVTGQGFPAALTYKGTRLFLVAGAAPDQKSLDGLVKSANALVGPPPLNRRGEFQGAYTNYIDKVLKR